MSQAGSPATRVLVHHRLLSGHSRDQQPTVNVQVSVDSDPGNDGLVARNSLERRMSEYERKLAGISYMAAGKEQDSLLSSQAHELQCPPRKANHLQCPPRKISTGASGNDRVSLRESTAAQDGMLSVSEPSQGASENQKNRNEIAGEDHLQWKAEEAEQWEAEDFASDAQTNPPADVEIKGAKMQEVVGQQLAAQAAGKKWMNRHSHRPSVLHLETRALVSNSPLSSSKSLGAAETEAAENHVVKSVANEPSKAPSNLSETPATQTESEAWQEMEC